MHVFNVAPAEQAFFLFDHLKGEAKIKYGSRVDKSYPDKIISALHELQR